MHSVRLTLEKIGHQLPTIEALIYRERVPLSPFRYTTLEQPDYNAIETPPITPDFDDSAWDELLPETYWLGPRTNFIARGAFEIPAEWETLTDPVGLYLPMGEAGSFSHPEMLIYVDGVPYATCDRHHEEVLLPFDWRDGQAHALAMHGWTGNYHRQGDRGRLLVRTPAIVRIDQKTRDFHAMARNAHQAATILDEANPVRPHLLNALNDAFNALDLREPFGDSFYTSVEDALRILQNGLSAAGSAADVTIHAAGHAHIDVAWLWTLGQTRRKAGRTFHNVLRLMEQFPEYHFTQSQPQLYDYIREDYPELFEDIKARVKDGQWEAIGGMWVEADCNLSGPESLARQFLLGRTFFREHFGADAESPVLWLPDVFGYAWNLPQLIKQAGLEYFFTIKIGWNRYNRLPVDSFWWQGLDGTRVLTHFSTTPERNNIDSKATYNATPNALTALGTWKNFQQKEYQRDLLMSYGWGDGGGGPTREMLENIRVLNEFPGLPQVKTARVGDFFKKMEKTAGETLPTWNGELYFELHRGTYTTQARNKRANRKSEFLLHDAEFAATQAALLDADYVYPEKSLNKAWELVCLNQFHDIIPGSSITDVYRESLEQYETVREMGELARDLALAAIAQHTGGDLILANPTGFARHDLAFVPGDFPVHQRIVRADGTPVLAQPTQGGAWLNQDDLPPFSISAFATEEGDDTYPDTGLSATPALLENKYLRVEFNEDGDIIRLYDKSAAREILPAGAVANQFIAFEDRPTNWDAWEIDIYYDDKPYYADPASSVTVVEKGPLRASIEIKRRILHSTYTQRISLAWNSPRLDFDTAIDWQEKHVLLKTAFPVDVLATSATYEIQWGNVERPTHHNTSWDWARFESCAQKWVDLSEGDYGVSLLNDCKYGHDIKDGVMRLSLLRAPTDPDPHADEGAHTFAYALFPHSGPVDTRTICEAYTFNDPIIAYQPQAGTAIKQSLSSLFKVDAVNIVIETVKRAEDGNGLIVRLYETQRARTPVTLSTSFAIDTAYHANIMEENGASLPVASTDGGSAVSLTVKPFEIVTLRVVPA